MTSYATVTVPLRVSRTVGRRLQAYLALTKPRIIAQGGIVVATGHGNLKEVLYLAVPSVGLVVLPVFTWFRLTG